MKRYTAKGSDGVKLLFTGRIAPPAAKENPLLAPQQ